LRFARHQKDKKLLMGLTLLDSSLTLDKNGPDALKRNTRSCLHSTRGKEVLKSRRRHFKWLEYIVVGERQLLHYQCVFQKYLQRNITLFLQNLKVIVWPPLTPEITRIYHDLKCQNSSYFLLTFFPSDKSTAMALAPQFLEIHSESLHD
jgi:hypothetical protein